jgi:hypothetical protein
VANQHGHPSFLIREVWVPSSFSGWSGAELYDALKNKIQDQLQMIDRQFDDLNKSRALLKQLLTQ